MPFDASVVRVMIASPSDVSDAREAVEQAIHGWNREHSENRHVIFLPWRWEESAIPLLDAPAQTIINAQGVDRSDLIVALFGSRLGSPSSSGAANTVEEIERARAQGKPVHLYFSDQPRPSNIDPDQLKSLLEFQRQASDLGLYGSFATLDDLRRKVESALSFYEGDVAHRKENDYFERGDSDRIYEEVGVHWEYRSGAAGKDVWDAQTDQLRKLIVRDRRGLANFTIALDKDGDHSAPAFGISGHPRYELDTASTRSSPGSMTMRPPSRMSGSSFAQDIQFSPQLGEGDSAHLIYRGALPSYRFAYSEDIIAGSASTTLGLRDWDFSSYDIFHPIGLLTYSVFLADELGASPLGPRVDHAGMIDNELTSGVLKNGYSQERSERNGEAGWEMKVTIREPKVGCSYFLMWRPPSRA